MPLPVHSLEINLNRADFEGLQQMAAGLELYLELYNSYDLAGAFAIAMKHSVPTTDQPSAQTILGELFLNPKFGTIRQQNGFKHIKEMGIDGVSAIRWILSHQDTLCPVGTTDPRNRLGSLFNEGMCIDQNSTVDLAKGLRQADSAIAGNAINVTLYRYYEATNFSIQPSAIFNSPISDLRTLLPLQTAPCGNIIGLADPTLGGLFPNHDGNTYLSDTSTCYYN